MKNYVTLLFLLMGTALTCFEATAQRNNNMFMVVNSEMYSGEAMNVFDLRDRATEIQTFWDEDWQAGRIILKDSQQVSSYPLRYDVYNEELEIKTNQDIKVLPTRQVLALFRFEGGDTLFFVDMIAYLDLPPNPAFMGLSQVLYDGKVVLLKRKERELLKANYVPALDAGNINDKIIFIDTYYLYDGQSVERLPRSKGKLRKFLMSKGLEEGGYLKEAKIHPKNPEDLIRLCQYLETQMAQE